MSKTTMRSIQYKNISKQQGWTFWSLTFVIGIIILFSYIGLQLFPVYTTNENVKNAMQLAADNTPVSKISRAAIVRSMKSQLYLDGANDLLDYKKDLDIKRSPKELILKVTYERRVPLFFNLSLVATFENEVIRELSSR